jgi:hypothetical protein
MSKLEHLTPRDAAGIVARTQAEDVLATLLRNFEERQVRIEQSLNGIQVRGARAVQVGTGGTTRPSTSNGSFVGWSLRETTGTTAAMVEIREGAADGPLLAAVGLAPGETVRDWFAPGGISYGAGLWVTVTDGAVDGAVYLRGGDS